MIHRTAKSHRIGFTLIEMVVALVLASLMMVGLLQIVSLVSRETNQLRGEQTDYLAIGTLSDRMRADLVNARGMTAGPGAIALAGFVGTENLAGIVRYERSIIDGQPVLLRRSDSGSEICWIGFGGFVYETDEAIDADTPVAELSGGLPPIPSRFRIGVLDGDGRILIDEVIHHHAQ